MWEWSKTERRKKQTKSLQSSFDKILSSDQDCVLEPEEDVPSPDKMKEILLSEIEQNKLHGFTLKECKYHPQTWGDMSKNSTQYNRMRKTFLKLIGYSNQEELRQLGFDEEDIELLKNKKSPENYNVHIKIPLDFGGSLDMDNLCFIKSHPLHDQVHHLLEKQICCGFLQKYKFIYIPCFEGNIYHG